MVAWAYMFFETLGFSRICAIQSCALGFKSWEMGKGEHNPFFYTFQRQFFQIVPILNPTKYAPLKARNIYRFFKDTFRAINTEASIAVKG